MQYHVLLQVGNKRKDEREASLTNRQGLLWFGEGVSQKCKGNFVRPFILKNVLNTSRVRKSNSYKGHHLLPGQSLIVKTILPA